MILINVNRRHSSHQRLNLIEQYIVIISTMSVPINVKHIYHYRHMFILIALSNTTNQKTT